MLYIKDKKISACNSLEKYIKSLIQQNDNSYFPVSYSLSIDQLPDKKEEDGDE